MALISSIIGMILAIVDAEPVIIKTESQSIFLRLGVSISTICCLAAICHYYFHEWKIFKLDNSVSSWQSFCLSWYFWYLIIELLIVSIHPIPLELLGLFIKCPSDDILPDSFNSTLPLNYTAKNSSPTNQTVYIECDPQNFKLNYDTYTSLVIMMLGRMFLIVRAICLHQQFFNSPRVQLLGALNQINCGTLCRENICYICRHVMASSSGKVILCLITSTFNTAAWVVFIAEYYYSVHAAQVGNLKVSTISTHFESYYLIAITMMGIGYGDYYPVSRQGKIVCVMAGIWGYICAALLVAVITKKLTMSRKERYLHMAMMEASYRSSMERDAACVLQHAWRSCKKGRLNRSGSRYSFQKLSRRGSAWTYMQMKILF